MQEDSLMIVIPGNPKDIKDPKKLEANLRSKSNIEISKIGLDEFKRIVNVYVPDGSVQAYKDDSNWGKRPIFPISQYQAIDNVQSGKVQSTKVIKDGILYIERNGKTYNAQGAEVR